jgi:hypothetical protein
MRGIVVASLACIVLAGCGPKGPPKGVLAGTITYNGQPVNGATLTLEPASGTGTPLNIPVAQDGTFRVASVLAGDYKITVQGSAGFAGPSTKGMSEDKKAEMQGKVDAMKTPATIAFPRKYMDKKTTDLTCKVVTGENPPLKLELKD